MYFEIKDPKPGCYDISRILDDDKDPGVTFYYGEPDCDL